MKVYCLYCKHSRLDGPSYPIVGCDLIVKKRWFHKSDYWDYEKTVRYGNAKKKNRHNECKDFEDKWTREFTLKNTNNGE